MNLKTKKKYIGFNQKTKSKLNTFMSAGHKVISRR